MWHIFENFDGSFTAYYDAYDGALGAALLTGVFIAILMYLGVACWPYLTIPVLSLGLGFGIPGICGRGMNDDILAPIVTMPLVVFAWAATSWVVMATYEVAGTGPAALIGYLLLAIIGIVGVFMPTMEWIEDEGVGLIVLLVEFIAMAALWFSAGLGGLGSLTDAQGASVFRWCFIVLGVIALGSLAIRAVLGLPNALKDADERRRMLLNGALCLAGFAPLVVASLLAGLGSVAATVAALVVFAGIGFGAAVADAKGAQWALLPLLVFGSAAIAAQAQVTYLPPDNVMLGVIELCRTNGLVQFFAGGAAPIIDGFVSVLSAALNAIGQIIVDAFGAEPEYVTMASTLSLYASLFVAAFTMGIGSLLGGVGSAK